MEIECHKKDSYIKCSEPCTKLLNCGHPCKKYCGEICANFPCKEKVDKKLKCGHILDIDCSKDPDLEKCPK